MTRKSLGMMSFADGLLGNNKKLNQRLDKLLPLVNWKGFEEKLNKIYSSSTGRPSYPLLLLFKGLLIQTWYDLSDYALEEALDDRLSFRRFIGLSAMESAPDHSTFSRFRAQLIKHGVEKELFAELDRQLEQQHLILKKGTLVDATVIKAAPKKPNQNEDGSAGKSPIDPDASWTKKGGRYLFGYKVHLGVDQESELIRRAVTTPAHVHDGEMIGSVVSGDEDWVFADKAYDSEKNDEMLRTKRAKNGILIKGHRGKKLSEIEKKCNRILSKMRCPVERVFGTWKRTYGYHRGRYVGLQKNNLQMILTSMAYNLRRMGKLCA